MKRPDPRDNVCWTTARWVLLLGLLSACSTNYQSLSDTTVGNDVSTIKDSTTSVDSQTPSDTTLVPDAGSDQATPSDTATTSDLAGVDQSTADTSGSDTTPGCATLAHTAGSSTSGTLCATGHRLLSHSWGGGECRLDLTLTAPSNHTIGILVDGTLFASALTDNGKAQLAAALVPGQTYSLEISGSPSGKFSLESTVTCKPAVAPTCPTEDHFEDNDLFKKSVAIHNGATVTGTLCGNDWDYFGFMTKPGCRITLDAKTTYANDQNVDLYLEYNTLTPLYEDVIAHSSSETDDEQITWTATRDYYYARLNGGKGKGIDFVSGSYALTFNQDCSAWTCPQNDSWDQGQGNNTNLTAVSLKAGDVINGILCTADEDWFQITANACKPQVTITTTGALVDAIITDTSGKADPVGGFEVVGTPASGTYVVRTNNKLQTAVLFKISAPNANNETPSYTATFDCVD